MISVELKLTYLLQYFESDYIVCMTSHYLLAFIHKCHVTRSASPYNRLIPLLLDKYTIHVYVLKWENWNYDHGYVNMTVNLQICQMNEQIWRNEHFKFPPPPRIPILWRHEQLVRQRMFRSMSHHCCIKVAAFFNFKGLFVCLFDGV